MTTQMVDANGKPPMFRRGTSPSHVFHITNLDGTPKNLTGATEITFAIAKHRGAPVRELQLTLGAGTEHDGDAGNVTVSFTKEQTEALLVGRRWCELWITDVDGVRDMPGEGDCIIYETLVTIP